MSDLSFAVLHLIEVDLEDRLPLLLLVIILLNLQLLLSVVFKVEGPTLLTALIGIVRKGVVAKVFVSL